MEKIWPFMYILMRTTLGRLLCALLHRVIHFVWSFETSKWKFLMGCSHLSKRKSDLKQKCSQLLISFSGMVFHTFSHGGIHFAQCVTFKNQFSKLLIGCYFWNTVPKNSIINSVHFCLQPLERCAVSIQYSSPVDFNRLPVDCWNLLALTAAMLCCVCFHTKTLQANNSDQEKNVLQFPP